MFKVGDKVIINKDRVTIHIPPIEPDDEIHEVIKVDKVVDIISYVLSGYEKNYFVEEELLNAKKVLKENNKTTKQKMTLEQIEATLGFEIELIESKSSKKKK